MDYCIAIDRLRPGAAYKRCNTYADLVETWADATPLPSDAELIAAYDAWVAEQEAAQAIADTESAIQSDAYAGALNIPDWATWRPEHFQNWYESNLSATQIAGVTNLATARDMLNLMSAALHHVIMLSIYQRNALWPSIQEDET
jgi:hypothetical protein